MQHIYIVRHGQSQANAHKIVAGSQPSHLTELGKQQAAVAGERAKKLHIDVIACSAMQRAQTTAHIIAEQLDYPSQDIITLPELTERNLGALEGHSYASDPRHNGNYANTETYAGVESLAHFNARVQHALRQIMQDHPNKNVLVVCHMGVGRMLQLIASGQPLGEFYNMPRLENATIYQLT